MRNYLLLEGGGKVSTLSIKSIQSLLMFAFPCLPAKIILSLSFSLGWPLHFTTEAFFISTGLLLSNEKLNSF